MNDGLLTLDQPTQVITPTVVMTVPSFTKGGGVANYCRVITKYMRWPTRTVVRGSRAYQGGKPRRLWHFLTSVSRVLADYGTLWRALRSGRGIFHHNTSLHVQALSRDIPALIMAKAAGRPTVLFVHGWDEPSSRKIASWRYGPLRSALFRADAIIVLAKQFAESLREMGYHGPIYVESTPVDDDDVASVATVPSRTRFSILFMARVEKPKGIYIALDATLLLQQGGRNVGMTVCGDGSELAKARKYAHDRGIANVDFVGYVVGHAKAEMISNSDLYILPTVWGEGLPTTVVEAMAFGLPVVSRPVGGVADVVQHGVNGLLTESIDSKVFAGLVEKLMDDEHLRERIGKTNKEVARKRFYASACVGRLTKIYSDTIAATTGRH